MTSSSAEHRADARGRTLRLAVAGLVAAGALLGASTTAPDATSAVLTDAGTTVVTVRTAADFDAPRRPAPAVSPTPTATAQPTPMTGTERPDVGAPAREDVRPLRGTRDR